jgi:hypothetical protein
MKIVAGILMFVLLGVVSYAQDQKAPTIATTGKVIAEIGPNSEKAVKNSPFSADAVSESVQTLADGNRIVRNSTSKLYRNTEGRFRREFTGGTGGMFGSLYTYGQGITLFDPVRGFRYSIDPNLQTTRQFIYRPHNDIRIVTPPPGGKSLQTIIDDGKLNGEIKVASGQTTVVMSDQSSRCTSSGSGSSCGDRWTGHGDRSGGFCRRRRRYRNVCWRAELKMGNANRGTWYAEHRGYRYRRHADNYYDPGRRDRQRTSDRDHV